MNTIFLESVTRRPSEGAKETLTFKAGVNTIVGPKDAGKTKWLETIDFLLGDPKPAPEALGSDIAQRYREATAELRIGSAEFTIRRDWHRSGEVGKIFVNGDALIPSDFSEWILTALGLPRVRFCSGNPTIARNWKDLSWRMLLRHIYLQERFYNAIAEQQPPAEQHASILQFLNLAQVNFDPRFEEQASRDRENIRSELITELHARLASEMFEEVFALDARSTVDESAEKAKLQQELDGLNKRRQEIMQGLTIPRANTLVKDQILLKLDQQIQKAEQDLQAYEKALNEFQADLALLGDETARLQRMSQAGNLFNSLRLTRCPACDQQLSTKRKTNPAHCFLCQQTQPAVGSAPKLASRLSFEETQIQKEYVEARELVSAQEILVKNQRLQLENLLLNRKLAIDTNTREQAIRQAAVPAELTQIDEAIGKAKFRIEEISRIAAFAGKVDAVAFRKPEEVTDNLPESDRDQIDFETPSTRFAANIREYLNSIGGHKGDISVRLDDRRFEVRISGQRWDTQVGATTRAFVIFGYHYALMSLPNFPRWLMLDFPVQLANRESIADKENYILKPFVGLCEADPSIQIIAAGRSFLNLEGARRIELKRKV